MQQPSAKQAARHQHRIPSMTLKGQFKTLLAVTALFGASSASAQNFTWFGETADGNWLAGVKVESVGHGRSGYEDSANIGLLFGYEFSRPIGLNGTSSIEFEYTDSFDKGRVADDSIFGSGGVWQSENIAMYFTYRTPGNVFFKAKLGALRSDVTTKLDGIEGVREQDTSFAYGAGLGVKAGQSGNLNIELEFTGSSGDNDLNIISVGGIYKFQ
jgi:hypothetical protein